MKTIVSVSQGSSEFDYDLETEFLGQRFRIIRLGTDGDPARAEAVLASVHPQADVVELSLPHTGAGLRAILQEWAVRHTQSELGHFFDNARVLFMDGQAGYRIARALSEHTDNLFFADPYTDFGVPRLLTSLKQLETYTSLAAPVMRRPLAGRAVDTLRHTPLYRLGEKLVTGSLHRAVSEAQVLVSSIGDLDCQCVAARGDEPCGKSGGLCAAVHLFESVGRPVAHG